MLKTRIGSCQNCGRDMFIARSTRAFCSDGCRKAASREASSGRRAEDDRLIELMSALGLIGCIWPVFSWDQSDRVYALVLPRHHALAEINRKLRDLDTGTISEADLLRVMRLSHVADYGHHVEAALIRDFYKARRDRRIQK